jgi:hypothetical protein
MEHRIMTNGGILLVVGVFLCVSEVGMGAYIAANAERFVGTSDKSPQSLRKVARVMMAGGPIILLVFAALAFGLVPAATITPITL